MVAVYLRLYEWPIREESIVYTHNWIGPFWSRNNTSTNRIGPLITVVGRRLLSASHFTPRVSLPPPLPSAVHSTCRWF